MAYVLLAYIYILKMESIIESSLASGRPILSSVEQNIDLDFSRKIKISMTFLDVQCVIQCVDTIYSMGQTVILL